MSQALDVQTPGAAPAHGARREIGRIVGELAGPTLIAVGGMHGNEPGGVVATTRVLDRLARPGVAVRGEMLALSGNLGALRAGRRCHVKDLNRQWTEARLAALAAQPEAADDAEDREQRELHSAIGAAVARARGPVHLVDLHTTSAPGIPFVITGDTLAQRALTAALPLPTVLGLEDQLDGALSQYWTRRGLVTFAVEGGQHDAPASIDSLEAVLHVVAAALGLASGDGIGEDVARALRLLDERRAGLPRSMEVVERHAIAAGDGFVMAPGFRNLDRARGGQVLARDVRGEIRARHDGLVILPLYQGSGDDGFFWGRELGPVRRWASAALRRAGVHRAVAWLPGVRPDGSSMRMLLSARAAEAYPRGMFRMLGYRKMRPMSGGLVIERQG